MPSASPLQPATANTVGASPLHSPSRREDTGRRRLGSTTKNAGLNPADRSTAPLNLKQTVDQVSDSLETRRSGSKKASCSQ